MTDPGARRRDRGAASRADGWFAALAWGLGLLFLVIPAVAPIVAASADRSAWRVVVDEAPRVLALLRVTATMVLGVIACSVPLGLLLALALFRLRVPLWRIWVSALATAAFCPLALYAAGWQACVGPYGFVSVLPGPRPSIGGMPAAIAIHALAAIPWVCGILALGLLAIERELEEEARLVVDNGHVLWWVCLRSLGPALALAALVAAVPVVTDMTVSDLFVIRTFAEEVYTQYETGGGDGAATLFAIPLSGVSALMLVVLAQRAKPFERLVPMTDRRWPIDRSTAWLFALAAPVMAVYALPLLGLVRQLGLTSRLDSVSDAATMRWSGAVAAGYLGQEISQGGPGSLRNLAGAGLTGGVTALIATVLAWHWRWGRNVTRMLGTGLLAWLFVLPGPVLALGLIDLFNRPIWPGDPYDGPWVLAYGQVVRALPFALVVLAGAVLRLDRRMFDAAALEGAGSGTLLMRIAAPNLWPAIALAWVIAGAFALCELPASKLLAPPGIDPFSVRLFHLLHTGTANQQAAFGLVLLGFVALASGAGMVILSRWRREPANSPPATLPMQGPRR